MKLQFKTLIGMASSKVRSSLRSKFVGVARGVLYLPFQWHPPVKIKIELYSSFTVTQPEYRIPLLFLVHFKSYSVMCNAYNKRHKIVTIVPENKCKFFVHFL